MENQRKEVRMIKKNASIILLFLCLILSFSSCSNEIDKNDIPVNNNSSFSNLFVQKNIANWITMQIWDGENAVVDFSENKDSIKITGKEGWFNVVLLNNDSTKNFDLTDVSMLSFNIKGTIPLQRAKVSVYALGDVGDEKTLYEWAENPSLYNENTDINIKIDLSTLSSDAKIRCTRIFNFAANNDIKDETIPEYIPGEQWVEISSIDFLDENGNHVDIKYSEPVQNPGSFNDVFLGTSTDMLDVQAWEGTCTLEFEKNIGMRVLITEGTTWFTSTFVVQPDEDGNARYLDYSDIYSISFDIRGTLSPDEIKVGYLTAGYEEGISLSELTPEGGEYTSDAYATYTFNILTDFSEIQKKHVSRPLTFSNTSEFKGKGYFEVKNIVFKDKNGNPTSLKVSSFASEGISDFTTLFSNLGISKDESFIDLQVWSNTFKADFISEGMRVIPISSGWFGGAIVNQEANLGATDYDLFDFSNITKMTFEIKGSMPASALRFYITRNEQLDMGIDKLEYPGEGKSLADFGVEILEDEWSMVTFDDLPDFKFVNFPIAFGNNGSGWEGGYFIIRNITYYDAYGNSVELKYVK